MLPCVGGDARGAPVPRAESLPACRCSLRSGPPFAQFGLTKHARAEAPAISAPRLHPNPSSRGLRDRPRALFAPTLMLRIAKSMRFNIQGEDSLQRRRQSTWCFLNGIWLSNSSVGVKTHTFASFGPAVRAKARNDEPHGPVSPARPHFCLWCEWVGAMGAAQCVRQWHACPPLHVAREQDGARHPPPCAICPDAEPPRIRGIHRVGRVAALGAPRIAYRERQVEIFHALTATSAKNRCISQPVVRVLCESLCLHPRFSARGSRIPRSARSPRRACQYWSCDRRRQSNAGRGSRWRTSVCCSRAPNLRRPFHRR